MTQQGMRVFLLRCCFKVLYPADNSNWISTLRAALAWMPGRHLLQTHTRAAQAAEPRDAACWKTCRTGAEFGEPQSRSPLGRPQAWRRSGGTGAQAWCCSTCTRSCPRTRRLYTRQALQRAPQSCAHCCALQIVQSQIRAGLAEITREQHCRASPRTEVILGHHTWSCRHLP